MENSEPFRGVARDGVFNIQCEDTLEMVCSNLQVRIDKLI